MSESAETPSIVEIGKGQFDRLASVLGQREGSKYNLVGWGGSTADLRTSVEGKALYPSSAFAVVAEGISRYKRGEERMYDDTDSMRELSQALADGSEVYGQAKELDETTLKSQIKEYLQSHGGVYDENINWQDFIAERATRIKNRADQIDEVNR